MATIDAIIRLRRGPDSERQSVTLDSGEIAYSTDIHRMFVGDGSLIGGYVVGNIITANTTPNPSAVKGDIFYDTNTTLTYILTSTASPHLISSYRRISPIVDGTTLISSDGVFGINLDYFTNSNTGFVKLGGDIMSGSLTLNGPPTQPLHAATKSYTDTAIANALGTSLGQSQFVHLSGDILNGDITILSALNVYKETSIYNDLNVNGDVNVFGTLDLKHNKIKNFSPIIKQVLLGSSPNNTYTLTQDDNGSIIAISGSGENSIVYCPDDLLDSFNVMLIQISNSTVYILKSPNTTVQVRQIDGYSKIRKIYGVANLVCLGKINNELNYILAGDLT